MGNGGLFRVAEVVQMAIDEEHNGKLFYNALAQCAKSPVLREAAKRLAVQEEGHERAFTALRDRLGVPTQHETYPGEYANYMNALMNGKTFPDEEAAVKLAQEAGGDVAAVSTAILFEKNTLLFLSEMNTLVPDRDAYMVNELIDEERQHLVDLSNLRTMLTV